MNVPDVRTLQESERDALLELVDAWKMPDPLEGREFFARYVDGDPAFRASDVWVADQDGRLVSCVQIFPRVLRIAGREVPTGGIGTVFTDPAHRGRGTAGRLMRAAMDDMAVRGMELALLFAGPVPFYEALGWTAWPVERPLLRRGEDAPGPEPLGEAFDPARDLASVTALHARYSAARDGSATRSDADWRTNLANAGNPHEEFRVLRRAGRVVAYLRTACLARFLLFMEWGCEPGCEPLLAGLLAGALVPREADPLAPAERPSPEFRAAGSSR